MTAFPEGEPTKRRRKGASGGKADDAGEKWHQECVIQAEDQAVSQPGLLVHQSRQSSLSCVYCDQASQAEEVS